MKQVLQNLRTGENIVIEVPTPQPQPGMALVRTAASLVSAGTERMLVDFAAKSLLGKARSRPDLAQQVIEKARREGLISSVEAAFNRLDQPTPLGYSSAGTITALGEGLQGFTIGQRVACAGGGYAVHAEFALVPQNLLAALPDEVDFESGAFTTLGAIALHGFRLAETGIGEQVAVIGLGLLGQLAIAIASAAGCRVLGIDLDPRRVEIAEQMGANEAVSREGAQAVAEGFSRGRGCDAVLICADTSSSDPVELAGAIARDRARVVAVGAVGLEIPRKIYYEKELSFVNSRSYGPGRYDSTYEEGGQDYPIGYVRWTEGRNFEAFVDLLARGQVHIDPLITHRFPIDQAPQAYELITGKQEIPFLGVLLTYKEVLKTSDEKLSDQDHTIIHRKSQEPIGAQPTTINLGILGAGNFASAVMLPALSKVKDINLVGIASAKGLSAQNAAQRYKFRYATSDANQVLNDPVINTIAILTRHHLHAQQVIAALKAGKHVFCEKPLAITPHELNEIFEVLDEVQYPESGDLAGRSPLLTVGFNRRFAPFAQQLAEFLADRQEPLIAHYRVNAGYLPLTHWLHDPDIGGGRIVGEGCHFIDFLIFLVGEPPTSVTAAGLQDAGRYREDNLHLVFTFMDGSIGTIDYLANGDKAFPKERLEVFTGGQVGVLDDFRTFELVKNGKHKQYHSRLRQDKGHAAEWEAFKRAIANQGPPPIPYEHLRAVSQASFVALKALRSGEKQLI